MFNIEAEEIKELLVKHYPFLELEWKPVVKDAIWFDGTEIILAMKLDSGTWEFHTLSISCDGDEEGGFFDLIDYEGNPFTEWELEDFDYMAIQSGGMYIDNGEW